MEEQWRVIPGTDGIYWASDKGRIKHSGKMNKKTGKVMRDKVIKLTISSPGLLVCSFHGRTLPVSRMVYLAWKGEIKKGEIVAHLDNDPTNVAPANLFIVDRFEFLASKPKTGRHLPPGVRARLEEWALSNPNANCEDTRKIALEVGCAYFTARRYWARANRRQRS